MVTISSFSDRTNFLNFKHSVSELPILILCCSLPKWLFFFPFLEEGAKSCNTVFENDTLALLCMLTTSMLLSCFGFIVIVRHSMQVYNYFLIKTQCVLCFYKWWPLVWLGWGVGGPHCRRVASALASDSTGEHCFLHIWNQESNTSWWGRPSTGCWQCPFCRVGSSCPG